MPDGPMGHRFVGVALNQREATYVTVSIGDDVVAIPKVPQNRIMPDELHATSKVHR